MSRRQLPRLTGISLPVGGVQWEYQEADRAVAARIISYLEDRRVLYVISEAEVPEHCVESVLDIRRFLSVELGGVVDRPQVAEHLRSMRAAARRFLDVTSGLAEANGLRQYTSGTPMWAFNQALGELRASFGVYIALLAQRYKRVSGAQSGCHHAADRRR